MSITFRVDDVERVLTPVASRSFAELFPDALVYGLDPASRLLTVTPTHPLLAAVHLAFSEHRPLAISPDAFWLTIAQGVAQHVRLNAEKLRSRFVRHEGKKRLEVEWDEATPPADAAGWREIVHGFRGRIGEELGAGVARLLTCDFSTSGEVERVASEIVLLDVFSPYYDYMIACVCGIPEVTLLGTVEDWRSIRARIDVLAELDLSWWTASLAPIADALLETAGGKPDPEFWRSIYKPQEAYGWDRIAGWIARLYPYLGHMGRYEDRNPMLAVSGWAPVADEKGELQGITTREVGGGLSSVFVRCVDRERVSLAELVLEGGLVGVIADEEGRIAVQAGFVVRRASACMEELVERIRAEHAFVPAQPAKGWPAEGWREDLWQLEGLSAELIALYRAVESAELFGGSACWRIRSQRDRVRVELVLPSARTFDVRPLIDLPDGTFIAVADTDEGSVFIRARSDALVEPVPDPDEIGLLQRTLRSTQPAGEVSVVGRALAPILARAFDTGGSVDLPQLGTLLDVVPAWYLEPRPPPAPRKPRKPREPKA